MTNARDLAGFLEAVQLSDMRMVEGRERASFARKARGPIWIAGDRLGEYLQRDLAVEARVTRAIHLAHAAGAERRDDLETAERHSR